MQGCTQKSAIRKNTDRCYVSSALHPWTAQLLLSDDQANCVFVTGMTEILTAAHMLYSVHSFHDKLQR
jgi:hypothetical protein